MHSPEPIPFDLFVIKVASRCNLACGYCYEYFHGDDSWREKPRAMSPDTMRLVARRIAEHVSAHRHSRVSISLHGGEPFTIGLDLLSHHVNTLREVIAPICDIDIGMQTNGTLYDDAAHAWAISNDIGIGVSLDGPPESNNSRRPFHDGRPSTSRVEEALDRLTGTRVFNGILSVIDIESEPVATLRYLAKWRPPTLDFLLPHGHAANPPRGIGRNADGAPRYGAWLSRALDEWWDTPLAVIAIRTFEDIILRLAGRPGRGETLGTEPVTLLTIGPDGAFEGVDTLKSAFPGAHNLGLHARTHSLDDALSHRSVHSRQLGAGALSSKCRECRLLQVCGGGYLPHRLGLDGTFDHPSVYCEDLMWLIDHVERKIRATVRAG